MEDWRAAIRLQKSMDTIQCLLRKRTRCEFLMSENNQQSFLDSKTLVAVVLVGFSWLGWQWYLQSKYPKAMSRPVEEAVVQEKAGAPKQDQSWTANPERAADTGISDKMRKSPELIPEKTVEFVGPNLSFQITSKGMGLKNIRLNRFLARNDSIETLGSPTGEGSFATGLIADTKPIDFMIQHVGEGSFVGTAVIDGQTIEKTIKIRDQDYVLETNVRVLNPKDAFRGVTASIVENIPTAEKKSMFLPTLDHNEFYAVADGSSQRVNLSADKPVDTKYMKSSVVSLGSQYFAQAFVNQSSILPESELVLAAGKTVATTTISYPMINRSAVYDVKYLAYIGPKSLSLLKAIDVDLAGVINFGMFSFIAHYLLQLMILFHEWVGNWGVTIILLTIVVRALVLPFNVMSYKSMKAMQKIQPHLKAVREKYKDDSQRVSVETMNLMKTHKVNPLGGCLPLLLQFPIFLALYQVLGQSIELYRAPFILWIHDLSIRDPFYVLPALMGITLFFQQKITPNTMDPAQKKILMFMPLIFTFFMVSLPSGLTLYIFVSGLFGLVQQLYFMRERTEIVSAKS